MIRDLAARVAAAQTEADVDSVARCYWCRATSTPLVDVHPEDISHPILECDVDYEDECHARFLALNEIETAEPTQTTLDGREEPVLAPPAPESHETQSLFNAGALAGIRGQLAITDREGT